MRGAQTRRVADLLGQPVEPGEQAHRAGRILALYESDEAAAVEARHQQRVDPCDSERRCLARAGRAPPSSVCVAIAARAAGDGGGAGGTDREEEAEEEEEVKDGERARSLSLLLLSSSMSSADVGMWVRTAPSRSRWQNSVGVSMITLPDGRIHAWDCSCRSAAATMASSSSLEADDDEDGDDDPLSPLDDDGDDELEPDDSYV